MYPREYTREAKLEVVLQGMTSKERQELGNWKSAAEMASAAAMGDTVAQTALDKLKEHEAAVKKAEAQATIEAQGGGLVVPGTTNVVGGVPGTRNEDVLKGVNPGLADMVRGLVEGKKPYPSAIAQRQPYWEAVLRLAGQYEPGWDANLYKQRSETIKDFTSGQSARNVTALNTVTGHLDTLSKRSKELENLGWRPGNAIGNWVRNSLGDPRVKRFELARNAVADELERVFRGSGGSVEGIKNWKETVNSADSPEQLSSVIKDAISLMASRIEALRDQRIKGMGRADEYTFLTAKSRQILKNLGADPDSFDPPGGEQAAPVPGGKPIPKQVMDQARRANPGVDDELIIQALEKRGYTR